MKLFRPIAALLAFVLLFFIYRWDVQRTERALLSELQGQQVLFQNPDHVAEIVFENENGRTVVRRTPDGETQWRILEPAEIAANDTAVNAYLENLRGARRQAEFASDDLAQYGLDKPTRSVTVVLHDEPNPPVRRTLEFGSQPMQFGNVYARVADESSVFTVSEWLYRLSAKGPNDLRDRSIIRREALEATKLEVQSIRDRFRLERPTPQSNEWMLHADDSTPVPADRAIMDRVMSTLARGEFLRVEDQPTTSPENLGFDVPSLRISTNGNVLLEAGNPVPEREQFYARTGDGTLGIVPRSVLADFFRPAAEWGTKRLIWIPQDDIQQVRTRSVNSTMSLLRDGDRWMFPDMPGVDLRQDRAQSFIDALMALSANQLKSQRVSEEELRAHGILDESFEITVTAKDGTVHGVRFGRTDTRTGVTYALRTQDGSLWAIDALMQGRVFKFNRDMEERRLVPDIAQRAARFELEIGGRIMGLEKRGATWTGTFPGERPVIVPPSILDSFFHAFSELESDSEYQAIGTLQAEILIRFYAAGEDKPFTTVGIISKGDRSGLLEMDGMVVEVPRTQLDVFDEEIARLSIAVKSLAEEARTKAADPAP